MKSENLKLKVQQQYNAIAAAEENGCCNSSCCSPEVNNIMTESYDALNGYIADADLGLGCGLPTKFAMLQPGLAVVDLGSGAGNDAFIARHEVGATGTVIGVDFSPAMVARARRNAAVRGFTNVSFIEGDIESLPIDNNSVDVVISNCVLNLVPNKQAVFSEIFRVLKPGGHFSISDIVTEGSLSEKVKQAAEAYAGCVAGAIQKADYLQQIRESGFREVTVQKQTVISVPDDYLQDCLSPGEFAEYQNSYGAVYSITVFGRKN